MEADLAVLLAPDEPNWQTAAQLTSGSLMADATVQARAQDMQLSLGIVLFKPSTRRSLKSPG